MASLRMVAASGWRYHSTGAPSKVLRFEKFRVPFDRKGTGAVVKMLAAPVHRHDKNMIEGTYGGIRPHGGLPAVGGVEGMGVVEEVGSSAPAGLIKEGDFVWVNNPRVGTWATHVVTDVNNLDVVPNRPDVDIEWLASLSLFHTANQLVTNMVQLQPGDVVLQTGASSSVSQICQGMVRARGGRLIQTMQMGRADHMHLNQAFKTRGAFVVVPYNYARSNYMRRLLADLPPPKLLLNHTCGGYGSNLVKLLGDNGTCVTYGNTSHKPMQIPNLDAIHRNITFKGFFLPSWVESTSREQRMRATQNIVEGMTVSQGHAVFRAQRFKMESDSAFAFSNAWDAPLASRKAILRMVGEYGEWRRPHSAQALWSMGRQVWDDLVQMSWEASGATETPRSMKYYTPFTDLHQTFYDGKQSKELGHREIFFRRNNQPRYDSSERKL